MNTLRHAAALLRFVAILGTMLWQANQTELIRAQAARTPPAPSRTTTNQKDFKIPFSVGENRQNIIEVILHHSTDRGRTWNVYRRAAASAPGFDVQCQSEGEYWFALQTRDRNGRLHPPVIQSPELIIVVDTARPQLDFEIRPDAAGRLVSQWSATDPNLDPESLTIEYRQAAGKDKWIRVPTLVKSLHDPTVYQDQLAWWPETASRSLVVQAQISDTAGNTTLVNRELLVPQTARQPGATRLASASSGTDTDSRSPTVNQTGYQPAGTPAALSELTNSNGTIGEREAAAQEPAVRVPESNAVESTRRGPIGPPAPITETSNSPGQSWKSIRQSPGNRDQAFVASTQAANTSAADPMKPDSRSNVVESVGSTAPSQTAAQPTRSNSKLTSDSDAAPPTASSVLAVNTDLQNLRSMARPCNSIRFQLQYAIDAIGPEGIKSVELWMTGDGGRNWRRIATDPDRRSPIDVQVETEGIYGFRIVVVSNAGLKTRPPSRGDAADVWVNVDTTLPQVKITAAPFGTNQETGKLIVQWTARDANLHLRPITLQYSSQSNGPWTTIEQDIRNEGRYAWKPDKEIPDRIYLRIQARDQAGNVGTYQTGQAIDVSGLIPRGHIRGIVPIPEPDT